MRSCGPSSWFHVLVFVIAPIVCGVLFVFVFGVGFFLYGEVLSIHSSFTIEAVAIGVAPITQLRMCVIKLITLKGAHLLW